MAVRSSDLFRKILTEFKEADTSFSSAPGHIEKEVAAQRNELARQEKNAKGLLDSYRRLFQGKRISFNKTLDFLVSPRVGDEFQALNDYRTEIQKDEDEINQIKERIQGLNDELGKTLLKEYEEREFRTRRRRNKIVRRVVLSVMVVCLLVGLHFWLMRKTTLSFEVSLDGKPLPAGEMSSSTLDGRPFASGDRILPGHHSVSVTIPHVEPVQRSFWTFYGSNGLGMISLTSFKGSLCLLSDPPGAEFSLIGKERDWQGHLPTRIDAAPAGTYRLMVRRKGWTLNQEVTVERGKTVTNVTDFPYGSIKVNSNPLGLTVSVNGVKSGRTPVMIQEVRPGKYTLSVSNDDGELTANLAIGPKETAKHDFIFRFGTLQLSTVPSGATVARNGKEIGKTPLTLNHVLAGERTFHLRLAGYVETNATIDVSEDTVVKRQIRLVSLAYIRAMQQAREAFDGAQFQQAKEFLAKALGVETNDPAALEMRDAVSNAIVEAEAARKEAARKAEEIREEKARKQIVGVIERAITATGGREALSRFKALRSSWDMSGTDAKGDSFTMFSKDYIQSPDKIRLDQTVSYPPKTESSSILGGIVNIRSHLPARQVRQTVCLKGSSGWAVSGPFRTRRGLNSGELIVLQNALYEWKLSRLLPLLNGQFSFAMATNISDVPDNSTAIYVRTDGRPDAILSFDNSSGLLAEIDLFQQLNGRTLHSTIRFSNYKDISGLQCPTHVDTSTSGVLTSSSSSTATEFTPCEEIPDRTFNYL